MAGFQTHIGCSTVIGIGYAVWGYAQGAPLETSILGGALCSVAGMLPDLDSDTGRPAKEMFPFIAAVVPALMLDRFKQWQLTNEAIAVATVGIYAFIRFGVCEVFKRFTVHRGMWHSVPACAISGLLTFLTCAQQELMLRIFLAFAVMLGFTIHLVLDEIWSMNLSTGHFGLKKSWGTAMKFHSDSMTANFITYSMLIVMGIAVIGDPTMENQFGYNAGFDTAQIETRTREYLRTQYDNARHYIEPNETLPASEWR